MPMPMPPVSPEPTPPQPVMLRGLADLVEVLPFLLDVEPVNSLVVAGLYATPGTHGRLGTSARVDLPASGGDFDDAARHIADEYVHVHRRRGDSLPQQVVLCLCATPSTGEQPQETMRRLAPLANAYRTAFHRHGLPVWDMVCIAQGRYWSYNRPESVPPEGAEVSGQPGPVSVAAVANGAVRAADPAVVARAFAPVTGRAARRAAKALGRAVAALNNRAARTPFPVLAGQLHLETRALIERSLARIARTGELPGPRDTARLIAGLKDRRTRDFALACDDHQSAHRLWQHLARHCVAPHEDFAPPVLTLYGWTSWLQGDTPSAKVAFHAAISTDPAYKMASYLHTELAQGASAERAAAIFREAAAEMGY
ncbi:DUF4192 domain-containing protein [Streptomyces chartreusis]|uniref:DUF4192 domain-containing protein n=1 Tax=Streptomyces chartreusis TaxID=1969 RepID=A0A7H8TNZ1_STRCX|nr:DUF4192 domain-containing protein [Streptomyces chartreusis]QKZ23840.1 DUF4192 domain-containing protein [Streptomyces chartreusis]